MTWIAVDDRLPDDGVLVLMWADGCPLVGLRYGERWSSLGSDDAEKPTHWMPLPAPPAVISEDDDISGLAQWVAGGLKR